MAYTRLCILCLLLGVALLGCKSKQTSEPEATAGAAPLAAPASGLIPPPQDVAAAPTGAATTESGLACVVLQKGSGTEHPVIYDTVKMHQVVWTTDGKMHMNTGDRGDAVEFDVTQSVLPGLREAIELMVEGEKRRCWIPGRLAFGAAVEGAPQGKKPLGTLVYDLSLVSLTKISGLPEAPPEVAAVPPDAESSASGLAWRVLQEGTSDKQPALASIVSLRYTGWTPEGKVFMTTERKKIPKSSRMGMMIPGWQEALLDMKLGEKRRLWIPKELAYRGQPGRPQATVVFDIELVAIAP
jgi:FKBP-type peptidyl-prolyl cis-trans isomerase